MLTLNGDLIDIKSGVLQSFLVKVLFLLKVAKICKGFLEDIAGFLVLTDHELLLIFQTFKFILK